MRRTSKNPIYILFTCALIATSLPGWAQSSKTDEQPTAEQPPKTEEPAKIETAPPAAENATGMTFNQLTAIVGKYTGDVKTEGSSLTFNYNDVPMTLIADERANRMRIITPVLEADQLSPEQMLAISLSNFHLALDARYALGGNTLFSTYIHPLKELTAAQVESAIRQVSMLRITFGTTYSSGEMSFGGPRPSGQEI